MADQNLRSLHPFLDSSTTTTTTASGACTIRSFSHDTGSGPILVLVHGWPQSSYMYRHIVAPLARDHGYSLFIPELPGYGFSSRAPRDDKRTVGALILEACGAVMRDAASRPLVWCSHDRGARVGHRMLVDACHPPRSAAHPSPSPPPPLLANLRAAILMDIVPTVEQFAAFANPRASVAYFHWPFLALPGAADLITAMGGDVFCGRILDRTTSANAEGAARIAADGATAHYMAQFARRETLEGSCADYKAGAEEDCDEQRADQEAGRKVALPLLTIYSTAGLGRMHDVDAVWQRWCEEGCYRGVGVGDGHGHYLPESCPDIVVDLVVDFVRQLGV
ncbi:alpha/beta-hydrolase [Polychaeton citri CBS 116435]|uniref:Alpha/beta-hydrolase n=1 Tax=Polychaeton citri CBS 116435 TaxID=1314669 RepID=A0A9P4QEU6_9PEZI|nr:alpha/beta-hydrolase [Polychaeton citri CBS 116435]